MNNEGISECIYGCSVNRKEMEKRRENIYGGVAKLFDDQRKG